MPAPWVAIAADIRRNRKMTALPSDQARYGWIVALGEAKTLQASGTFTAGQWDEVMGRHARYRDAYIEVGLLHASPSECDCVSNRGACPAGTLIVHDWNVYQREHAVRQARYRANRDGGSDTKSDTKSDGGSDTESDTPSRALSLSTVNSPLSENGDMVVDEVGESALDAYYRLTIRPPSNAVTAWLDRLCGDHREDDVVRVMVSEWQASPNPADFLGRVQTRLAVMARNSNRAAVASRKSEPLREQEAIRKRIESATPEEQAKAEANKQRIAKMLADTARPMP